MNEDRLGELARALGDIAVCSLWVWMAVRTAHCLQVISSRTIPYTRRTVWLIKILALIVGAGGVAGALADLGTPWFFAIIPAVIIVAFSFSENVVEVVPPKPMQDPAAHQSAWEQYWLLRRAYHRSALGFGSAILLIILTMFLGEKLPQSLRTTVFAVTLFALLVAMAFMSVTLWKWSRWPCPRCGCSFRGFWGRFWLPKHCVYCGLPRQQKNANRDIASYQPPVSRLNA